jgi:hypothetical protein
MWAAGCAGAPGKGAGDGGGADTGGAPLTVCAGEACVEPQVGGGLLLRFAGEARLTLPADAVAVGVEDTLIDTRSYDPTYPQAATRWAGLTDWGPPAAVDGGIELALRGADGGAQRLRLEAGPAGAVALQLLPTEAPPGGVVVAYRVAAAVTADEGLDGLGEWFDRPEHRGAVRPMHIVADLESESSYNEAHVPVPLLIGTRGWGLFAETDRPTVFDVAAADPERVLARLMSQNPHAFHFYLPLGQDRRLLGASPELLLRVSGGEVFTHPLAGSARRASEPAQDEMVARDLLASRKDQHEHKLVIDEIRRVLTPTAASWRSPLIPP